MSLRGNACWLLAATIVGGSLLPGCRHTCRNCAVSEPAAVCNCERCRAMRSATGPSNGNGVDPNRLATEPRPPVPKAGQSGRVSFPQSNDGVTYREATLMERMKFRLQRLNPLAGRNATQPELAPQQPAQPIRPIPETNLPYTPAPGIDESAKSPLTPLSPETAQRDFEPARIDVGLNRTAAQPTSAIVDPWPYRAANASKTTGSPRFLSGTGSGIPTAPAAMSTSAPVQTVRVRNFR